ncbi:hypothetical protein, partial [Streptomyces sp. P17]|uniref:hypothetical protein n=1 Tax=Streptomyces sp. P17 TaxID=3074716 RepID=UPI0028F431B4
KTTLLKTLSGLYPSEQCQFSGGYLGEKKSIFLASTQGLLPDISGQQHIEILKKNLNQEKIPPNLFFSGVTDKDLLNEFLIQKCH